MNEESKKSGNVFDFKILRRIFGFVRPYWSWFYVLVLLTLLVAAFAPLRPYLVQHTVDFYILSGDRAGLLSMILWILLAAFLQVLVTFAHTYLSGWLGQYIICDIRTRLYAHILGLKVQFFDRTAVGRLVTRTVSDVETLSQVFTNGLAAIIGDLLQLVFIVAIMCYTNWRLALVSLSTFPLLILATYVFKERVKVSFNRVRTAVANLNTFVQEHLTGMNIVQIFNSEEREFKKFERINKRHLDANIRTVLYYSIYFPVAEIIIAGGIGLLIWYGAGAVMEEQTSVGTLIAFLMYIQLFFRPVRMLADRFNTLQLGIVSAERILKLLDNQSQIPDNGKHESAAVKGDISFKNVWFAYDKEKYVLKNINFEVKNGETLALVGATGAGKSSVINLLSRFYEIQKGTITLENINLTDYKLSNLRRHIGVVLQDIFLFSDSIYRNITLGDSSISREQVMAAARKVGAEGFIEKLPGKLDYNVMERGAALSVGQRQLIAFVRVMVQDPKILILDEATSSVDSDTEQLIQAATEKMMQGRTSIVIAHRLSTIRKADRIIVLDKGEIKENGTHEELLAKNSYYAKLHKIQYV